MKPFYPARNDGNARARWHAISGDFGFEIGDYSSQISMVRSNNRKGGGGERKI